MIDRNRIQGVTLIELMIALAIIGIVAAVAAPFITGYVGTSREAVLRDNIKTIRLFQEEYRLRNRSYVEGTYDPSNPDAAGGLKDLTGWEPGTDKDLITYAVACDTDTSDAADPDCIRSSGYSVTATHADYPSDAVCIQYGADGYAEGDC
ncbi:MAG: prepilin-type N-terminal cleavage/methylation domain-containing protein [Gammaproteobacteria bacterium]|nr:prepilin-type N-terminal cleavage/methylation domain-containing protein [Gammaproteobacteria bacterium]